MKHTLHIASFIGCALLSQLLATRVSAQLPTTPPCHVVILWEENYAYSEIIGSSYASRINALAAMPNAAVFTQFFAIEHPSQPNYLDLFSGSNQGSTTDNYPTADGLTLPFTTPNLAAQLFAAGKTFKSYSEGLPSVGSDIQTLSTPSGEYYRKHNPCTNWSEALGTGPNTFPASVNQPFSAFPVNYDTLPTVSFVAPNGTNDMHDGSYPTNITAGDTWMYNNLDSFRSWTLDNNTLYIMIFDEDDDLHSNNIPVIFYGPMVKAGTYTENVNFWNLLHTIEQMYGLSYIGSASGSTSITDCWMNPAVTTCAAISSTTAVNNIVNTNDYSFKVMPNPASDVVNFNCSVTLSSHVNITITDATGRVTGKYAMTGTDLQVNTSAYAPGVYIYRIVNEKGDKLTNGSFVITHN